VTTLGAIFSTNGRESHGNSLARLPGLLRCDGEPHSPTHRASRHWKTRTSSEFCCA